MITIKCPKCNGRGGGYETCEGTYPDINYYYVDIGECERCEGKGEVEDYPVGWDDEL